jgi:hypothetical protein
VSVLILFIAQRITEDSQRATEKDYNDLSIARKWIYYNMNKNIILKFPNII